MPNIQCINCNVRLTRIGRHALKDEVEVVVNTIRLWTYPREITPSDHICHACWQLAAHGSTSENVPTRQVGHQHVCIVCGRSILRISRRRIMIDGATEQQQRLCHVISNWIQPRELTPADEACVPCWLRALRNINTDVSIEPAHSYESQIGDHSAIAVCPLCENPLLSTMRKTPAEERRIYELITQLLEHRQMPSINEICCACRERAEEILYPQINVVPESIDTESPQYITLPNLRRAAETARHCIFQECTGTERHIIPEEDRRSVLLQFQYYIPRGARICSHHLLSQEYCNLYSAEYSMDTFKASYIEDIVFILMEGLNNISYENIQNYPDHQVEYFIGFSKRQHQQILNNTPNLKNMHRGSFALTALLCKLRTGDSGDRLSCLFQVPRRTLETLMSIARKILIRDFVPQHLGFGHMTIEQVAAKNSIVADGLLGDPDASSDQKPAITIADATYLYTQKSSNYLFQKETYSLHKYRNLVKPFILCCCDGYIIDVRGPYSATTNDATIMRELLNQDDFNNFFREDDIFVLDRGFRDCMDALHDKGYIGHMPETKEEGHPQLTTLEANRSRCVTINRWVVEGVNGRFKRDFKLFRHEYFNRACPHAMDDFKIAAALLNSFATQYSNSENAEQFVNIIHERMFLNNTIAEIVNQENLNRRGSLFIPIDGATMIFPRFTIEELVLFACGTYQIKQARSYVGEHFRFHGIYTLEVTHDNDQIPGLEGINPMLLRAKIKSRHSSGKTYFIYIVYERNVNGREAILSYCCNCIVGLRTVGCCSHVMSVIWYLGYARYESEGVNRPASFLDNVILRVQQ